MQHKRWNDYNRQNVPMHRQLFNRVYHGVPYAPFEQFNGDPLSYNPATGVMNEDTGTGQPLAIAPPPYAQKPNFNLTGAMSAAAGGLGLLGALGALAYKRRHAKSREEAEEYKRREDALIRTTDPESPPRRTGIMVKTDLSGSPYYVDPATGEHIYLFTPGATPPRVHSRTGMPVSPPRFPPDTPVDSKSGGEVDGKSPEPGSVPGSIPGTPAVPPRRRKGIVSRLGDTPTRLDQMMTPGTRLRSRRGN